MGNCLGIARTSKIIDNILVLGYGIADSYNLVGNESDKNIGESKIC